MRAPLVAILTLVLSAALLTTSACAANPNLSQARSEESAARPAAIQAPGAVPPAAPAAKQAGSGGAANQAADQAQQNLPSLDRMIVRTVTMTIAVSNVQESFKKIEQLVSAQRGYLAGTSIRQDGDRQVATLTLRVPADPATYQATLEQLRGLAERVVDEQSQAQDVTEEYVDLESRMRNLQASEQALLAVLAKAQRVEDIIQVQRELTNVRGQIEQIQGRKQALERRADMATITLTVREAATFNRPGWSAGATFERAVNALGAALRVVAEFGIYAVVFSPIWGGLAVALWLFILLIRRLSRRAPARPPFAPSGRPPGAPGSTVEPPSPASPAI
jgi:Domain of unknown function (DUF4349)